jgi:hypothetical protein
MTERLELSGDKMRFVETADGTLHVTFDDKGTGRSCGTCSLCCKLLPIPSLNKPAGQRCKHQKALKGCSIYPDRPNACKTWACRWLSDPQAAGLKRPDRTHYVVDLDYDKITQGDAELPALQVWCDPAFPDAHKDRDLRAFLLMMAERFHVGAIVRYGPRDGFLLIAPTFCQDGQWREIREFNYRSDETPFSFDRVENV